MWLFLLCNLTQPNLFEGQFKDYRYTQVSIPGKLSRLVRNLNIQKRDCWERLFPLYLFTATVEYQDVKDCIISQATREIRVWVVLSNLSSL